MGSNFVANGWLDCTRPDLHMIPEMEQNGFKVIFNPQDRASGNINPDHQPIHNVQFTKDELYVWAVKDGWNTAKLVDGKFQDHGFIKKLSDLCLPKIEIPKWKKELEKVDFCSQRQDSTEDQLKDLIVIANKIGFYDAADFIKNSLKKSLK